MVNKKDEAKKDKPKPKAQKKIYTEKRQVSNKSYINKMKEKKNMKINYDNHEKMWKKGSRNEDKASNSCLMDEKK